MVETYTYKDIFPPEILERYVFLETGSATKIAQSVCTEEFEDTIEVLSRFVLTSLLLLTRGGSRGPIPRIIDTAFHNRGWIEARVDLFKRTFLFPGQNAPAVADNPMGDIANKRVISEIYQQGYSVDNFKGRVALDVEWNSKDGNLDRDFSAYRAWHEEGIIDIAILITRVHEDTRIITDNAWAQYIKLHPENSHQTQTVNYRTTTTANFEKAQERVLRGDLGTCPILIVGIGKKTWDGLPWDGKAVRYDSNLGRLMLVDSFGKSSTAIEYKSNL